MGQALLDFLVGAAIIVAPQHNFALAAGSLAVKVGLSLKRKKSDLAKNGERHGSSSKPVTLQWDDLRVAFQNKKSKKTKLVFEGVSGRAHPGRLLAIMGASSAGKTTLLNCLAQQLPYKKGQEYSGMLKVNGDSADTTEYRQAYIQQDDIFYSQLTVRETLMTASRLQLGPGASPQKSEELVEGLIQKLGLSKSADTIVGSAKVRGLSGGERKRLSIACGLLGDPQLLFCDEPTTGLDSFQAEQVMRALKDLAKEGKTVIVAIHQPRSSIFAMFSDLILLSERGVVYNGPAESAVEYFEDQGFKCPPNYNPAEFLTDLISVDVSSPEKQQESEDRVAKMKTEYRSHSVRRESEPSIAQEASSSSGGAVEEYVPEASKQLQRWGLQGRVLLQRSWKQIKRDKATTVARVMSNVSSAIIFGSIYWRTGLQQSSIQNRMGLLQVAAINCAMSSVTKTLSVFAKERVIVERERTKKSYDVAPYFAAKLLAESPVSAVFPLIFGALLYPAAGLHPKLSRFAKFLGILTLESFASSSIGLAVGSIAPSPDAAQAIGPAVMVIFIVFGGYYVNSDTVPRVLRWVPKTSLIKYAFEALSVNEFKNLEFQPSLPASAGDALEGEQVLQRLSFHDSSIKKAMIGESRVILMNYWFTYCVLKARAPKYQRSDTQNDS